MSDRPILEIIKEQSAQFRADMAKIPRKYWPSWYRYQWECKSRCPVPGTGAGMKCTRKDGHKGAHQAFLNGADITWRMTEMGRREEQ